MLQRWTDKFQAAIRMSKLTEGFLKAQKTDTKNSKTSYKSTTINQRLQI